MNMLLSTIDSTLAYGVNLGGLLWLAIVFFVLAIIAYLFGARGVAGMSAGIGRTLAFVFLVLFVIIIIVDVLNGHAFG